MSLGEVGCTVVVSVEDTVGSKTAYMVQCWLSTLGMLHGRWVRTCACSDDVACNTRRWFDIVWSLWLKGTGCSPCNC